MQQPSENTPNTNGSTTNNDASPPKAQEQQLPKLSAQEFRVYNSMADHMNYFHDHFRHTWKMLYEAASTGSRPAGMSIRAFIRTAEQLCRNLTVHHTIEEQHIFPVLAQKMPIFKQEMHLLTQHKAIHAGLDRLEEYFGKCRTGENELRMEEVKGIMDSFGTTLWQHLDDEVEQLGAENMRQYWSMDEMRRMPM